MTVVNIGNNFKGGNDIGIINSGKSEVALGINLFFFILFYSIHLSATLLNIHNTRNSYRFFSRELK